MLGADERVRVVGENPVEILARVERQIARNAADVALRAERLAAGLEGADDLHEGLVYLLYVAGADVALETHVVGNAVDGISALRDDVVDADMVLVAEGLAQGR